MESKDLKQDVETTRRSLFVDSCNKLSDNLTSTSELVHYTGVHQMNEKLPERKRRKSEGEPATETGRIGSVVSKSNDEEDLIGDFTKPCCLPRIASKHQDLKSISPQTVGSRNVLIARLYWILGNGYRLRMHILWFRCLAVFPFHHYIHLLQILNE